MARIRSVHPSLFTDEAVVSCSPLARMLYIGLWTDADDQGLFEWKPLQIKMRLLPGDDADVGALLAELKGANLIAPLESAGKKLGAIRYFRRFQRPKKPNSTFVLPAEWVNYVGLGDASTEHDPPEGGAVPNQFPPGGEKSPQMEEVGGRREEVVSVPDGTGAEAPPSTDDLADLRSLEPKAGAWRLAVKVLMSRGGYPEARARPLVGKWAKAHAPGELWQACEAAWKTGTLDPVSYITAALERIAEDDSDVFLKPTEARQRLWMLDFASDPKGWRDHERGPKPGEAGCRVTPEIQREFSLSERGAA